MTVRALGNIGTCNCYRRDDRHTQRRICKQRIPWGPRMTVQDRACAGVVLGLYSVFDFQLLNGNH